jgi:hypothetical protein
MFYQSFVGMLCTKVTKVTEAVMHWEPAWRICRLPSPSSVASSSLVRPVGQHLAQIFIFFNWLEVHGKPSS